MSENQSLADYRKAQQEEWGTYVATAPIDIHGARAFNTGDPVPASHVSGGKVPADRVRKITKASQPAATTEKG